MNRSLNKLFSFIGNNDHYYSEEELFSFTENKTHAVLYGQADIDFINAYFSGGFDKSLLNAAMRGIFDLSFKTFDIILHAWLSELPVEREIINTGRKIGAILNNKGSIEKKRLEAEREMVNRLDENIQTVLKASAKVYYEIHRMMGLLRFTPNAEGEFIAECEPDHFILPALGEYFSSRFGETAWSIIDKKRNINLRRPKNEKIRTCRLNDERLKLNLPQRTGGKNSDKWEELWKHYHMTINNEDRRNPDLQRQLMPKRYWKYLPEKSE